MDKKNEQEVLSEERKKKIYTGIGITAVVGLGMYAAYKKGWKDGSWSQYQHLLSKITKRSLANNPIVLKNFDMNKKIKFIAEVVEEPVKVIHF